MSKKPSKKSETIEVRVSYEEKRAFMDACKDAGVTASHAIRGYIDDFLNPGGVRSDWRLYSTIGLAVLCLAALGFSFFTRPAVPPTPGEQVVRIFDENGDGHLSAQDLAGLSPNDQATLSWLLNESDTNGDQALDAVEIDAAATLLVDFAAGTKAISTIGGDENQAIKASNAAGNQQAVILVPPGLSDKERARYIEDFMASRNHDAATKARLRRLLKAMTASGSDEPPDDQSKRGGLPEDTGP